MARLSKDDKLIQQKPDADLNELRGDTSETTGTAPQARTTPAKVSPVITTESPFRAVPMLTDLPALPDDTVTLVEKKTGKRIPMTRSYAERFIRKNPLTHYVA